MSGHNDTFTCNVDGVSACSKAPEADVLIDSRLWQSVISLCNRFDTEWMAYMVGHKRESSGDYEVERLDFPEQTAGGAHVRNEMDPDFHTDPNTIGVIHSHVGMQAFFSKTDKDHANWPVEIVVNRRGEYEVSMRVQLPCGDFMRRSCKVYLLTAGLVDKLENTLKAALEKGEAKDKARRPAVVVWSSGGHGGSYGGAFKAADQRPAPRYPLGGKFMHCPIDGKWASGEDCCNHSIREMEDHIYKQRPIASPITGTGSLLGGKFAVCPICGCTATNCPHTITEMEAKEAENKAVAP